MTRGRAAVHVRVSEADVFEKLPRGLVAAGTFSRRDVGWMARRTDSPASNARTAPPASASGTNLIRLRGIMCGPHPAQTITCTLSTYRLDGRVPLVVPL